MAICTYAELLLKNGARLNKPEYHTFSMNYVVNASKNNQVVSLQLPLKRFLNIRSRHGLTGNDSLQFIIRKRTGI